MTRTNAHHLQISCFLLRIQSSACSAWRACVRQGSDNTELLDVAFVCACDGEVRHIMLGSTNGDEDRSETIVGFYEHRRQQMLKYSLKATVRGATGGPH